MHSNAVQALAGNPISALKTSKAFTNYSHSLILRVLRDRVFPVSNCQTTGTGTGDWTQNVNGSERYP